MVVDTGANIMIVQLDVLTKQLHNGVQATSSVLKTATGETATVHGKLQVKVKIGGAEVSHEALVADISDTYLALTFLWLMGVLWILQWAAYTCIALEQRMCVFISHWLSKYSTAQK